MNFTNNFVIDLEFAGKIKLDMRCSNEGNYDRHMIKPQECDSRHGKLTEDV